MCRVVNQLMTMLASGDQFRSEKQMLTGNGPALLTVVGFLVPVLLAAGLSYRQKLPDMNGIPLLAAAVCILAAPFCHPVLAIILAGVCGGCAVLSWMMLERWTAPIHLLFAAGIFGFGVFLLVAVRSI